MVETILIMSTESRMDKHNVQPSEVEESKWNKKNI